METVFAEMDVTLRDGREVHFRAVGTADEHELLQAFERLSPEILYLRFMQVVREPNLDQLRKRIASFPESGVGMVATVPAADGIDIVGGAFLVLANDPVTCEFAITVSPDYGRTGLGQALLSTLIDAAKRRGLKEMEGFVLAVNRPMLRLAARLGFVISADPDDWSVKICRLQLDGLSQTQPL